MEKDSLQFGDGGVGTRHNGQGVVDDGRNLGVHHLRLTFQGKLSRGPLLWQIGHSTSDLAPVLAGLLVEAKPDAEQFHWTVRSASHDGGGGRQYGLASLGAERQAHRLFLIELCSCHRFVLV